MKEKLHTSDIVRWSAHIEHCLDTYPAYACCCCGQSLFIFEGMEVDSNAFGIYTSVYVSKCYTCSYNHRFQYRLKNKRPFEIVKCLMI